MQMSETPAAIMIMIITVSVSLYTLYRNQQLMGKLALHPWSVKRSNKWYMLISSGFLHADMTHLIFNMLSFYFFAFPLEYMVGSGNFLIIYFGSMILADLTTLYKQADNPNYYSLGASGAVSGIVFSAIMFQPLSKMYIFLIPIGIPAIIFGPLYLIYCWYAAKHGRDHINHDAHFGGAIAGVFITLILIPEVIDIFIRQISL